MAYEARCKYCGTQLFDVPDFETFKGAEPVSLICHGCGTEYHIGQNDQGDVVYRRPHWKRPLKANKYG